MIKPKNLLKIFAYCLAGATLALPAQKAGQPRGYSIPLIDLANESHRQVVVDRSPASIRAIRQQSCLRTTRPS